MKITKLKIEGYKNLNIEFSHNSGMLAIIGNNGSGKSNLLEALSYIFKSLYKPENSTSFDYSIEYRTSNNENIRIEKKKSTIHYFKDNETLISIANYLPKKVVAIYSGEEKRLWKNCFESIYNEFIASISKTTREKISFLQTPQMLYINKYYWHISLLSLALSELEGNKSFIKDTLLINKIDKIKFDFNKSGYKDYGNNPTLDFIKKIDSKSEYTLEQLKKIIDKEGYVDKDVYKHLYLAFTPKQSKIIKDITIKFNGHLTIEDLSEGEKKLLLLKAAFEFAEQEDSLFILDEPDAHVHLNNKELIVNLFDDYKLNRQIVITTHSPTVTQCINDDNLRMINEGKVIEKQKQEIIEDIAGEFWNKQEQNIFITSKKPIILFVEGIHDKKHISNAYRLLGDEYKDLQFDIFSLGGEGKIHPFINGLYEANLNDNKLYIAIYDNDGAGNKAFTSAGYLPVEPSAEFRKLKEDKIKHNNFFSFKLPKPDNHSTDCTIENMLPATLYEEAYKEAFEGRIGKFEGESIDKINEEIKKDSKNLLAKKTETLINKEDFKSFRKLFDIIREINQYNPDQINELNKTNAISKSKEKSNKQKSNPQLFYFKRDRIVAKGTFNPKNNSFKLFSGSEVLKNYKSAVDEEYKNWRNVKISSNKKKEDVWCYTIKKDIDFESPSGAAKFVNAGNSNGWKVWKNEEGKTLDEIYRKNK